MISCDVLLSSEAWVLWLKMYFNHLRKSGFLWENSFAEIIYWNVGESFWNNLNGYCKGKVFCPLLGNNFMCTSYDLNKSLMTFAAMRMWH